MQTTRPIAVIDKRMRAGGALGRAPGRAVVALFFLIVAAQAPARANYASPIDSQNAARGQEPLTGKSWSDVQPGVHGQNMMARQEQIETHVESERQTPRDGKIGRASCRERV